ncbi:Membrane metallo-endopeptidase-like 1 [Homalodisca vitripennis]|nr:Membrane metallo-endopeptidase-like 1 [Homalodisca vitripennis]
MNQSANPCVDFFQFACGAWNKKHQIPEDRGSISVFEVLSDQLQIILKESAGSYDSRTAPAASVIRRLLLVINPYRKFARSKRIYELCDVMNQIPRQLTAVKDGNPILIVTTVR